MPTASNSEFIVANLEFDTIKSNLKTYLSSQSLFQDHDFEGSNMNVLLDVLAYNTYYNGMYLNHVASEMFLDSSQIRDSIYSHAKTLNYLPISYQSSVAYCDITIVPGDSPHTINIPRLTSFTSTVGDNTYTFSTNSDVSVYSNNSLNLPFNGKLVTGIYTSSLIQNDNAIGWLFGGDATSLNSNFTIDNLAFYENYLSRISSSLELNMNLTKPKSDHHT